MKKKKPKKVTKTKSKDIYVVVETREVWRGDSQVYAHRMAAAVKLKPKSKVIVLRRSE